MKRITNILVIVIIGIASSLVLSFWGTHLQAYSGPAEPPFANAVEQRREMISELKRIRELLVQENALISEQNSLLKEQTQIMREVLKVVKHSLQQEVQTK